MPKSFEERIEDIIAAIIFEAPEPAIKPTNLTPGPDDDSGKTSQDSGEAAEAAKKAAEEEAEAAKKAAETAEKLAAAGENKGKALEEFGIGLKQSGNEGKLGKINKIEKQQNKLDELLAGAVVNSEDFIKNYKDGKFVISEHKLDSAIDYVIEDLI